MPIYEYACAACGHKLEAIQKFSDSELKDCPVCGKSALKKLVSAAGFQLKGSGWYATDFKGGDKKNSSTKKESDGSGSSSDSNSNSDNSKKEPASATTNTKKDTKGSSGGGNAN